MGGSLKINTEDYNFVYSKFWNGDEGFDIDNYDGDAIYKMRDQSFRDDDDNKQFKQNLVRMVKKIMGDSSKFEFVHTAIVVCISLTLWL